MKKNISIKFPSLICLYFFLFTQIQNLQANIQILGLENLQQQKIHEDILKKSTDQKKLIFFWGSWCKECKEKLTTSLPEINKQEGVSVLTINMDSSIKRAKHFAKKNNITLPIYQDKTRALIKELKVFAVPHWAVYSKKENEWQLSASASSYDEEKIKAALKIQKIEF